MLTAFSFYGFFPDADADADANVHGPSVLSCIFSLVCVLCGPGLLAAYRNECEWYLLACDSYTLRLSGICPLR